MRLDKLNSLKRVDPVILLHPLVWHDYILIQLNFAASLLSSIQLGGIVTFCPLGYFWAWGYCHISPPGVFLGFGALAPFAPRGIFGLGGIDKYCPLGYFWAWSY